MTSSSSTLVWLADLVYTIKYTPQAAEDIQQLDAQIQRRVLAKILQLASRADEVRHVRLTGDWSGMYRLRVGDFRVVYEVLHGPPTIVVHRVAHRSKVYK